MALNLIVLALVLAATFMQSGFGFYSGVLNAFCTLASVALALGFYEPLNDLLSGQLGIPSGYSEPASIMILFLVGFAVLRTLADNYLRRPVQIHPYIDLGGGILCGFVVAQLTMGIMVISLLLLPLGGTVLQFSRYARAEDRDDTNPYRAAFERRSLWLRSDEMTVGLFNLMSSGSLSSATPLSRVYPNFLDAIYYSTNTVQAESSPSPPRSKRSDGFKDGIAVEEWWVETGPVEGRYRAGIPTERDRQPPYKLETYTPQPGNKLLAVRLLLRPSSADKQKLVTAHLFRPTMIRLVGRTGEEPDQHVPVIIGGADPRIEGARRIVDLDNNFQIPASEDVRVDAIFEVPEEFQPEFVEYRRHARASIAGEAAKKSQQEELKLARAKSKQELEDEEGKRTFGSVLLDSSGLNTSLPIPIAAESLARMPDAKIKDNELAAGRLSGAVSRYAPSQGKLALRGFHAPPGYELVQVRYKPREARTLVGNVFNYVAKLNQYFAVDDRADKWPLAGYFAIVKRGNAEFIELYFNGSPEEPLDPGYKSMLDFKDIKPAELEAEEAQIGLLFLVKSGGRTLTRIENQGRDGVEVNFRIP